MKITLTQSEIEQFVREGLSKQIQLVNQQDMVIDFTAGRGENGLTATIDIPYLGLNSLPTSPSISTVGEVDTISAGKVTDPAIASAPVKVVVQAEAPQTLQNDAEPAVTEDLGEVDVPAPATAGKSLFGTPAAK